ncbi:11769_t:CDS:1, partial [Ambispora leptoticha]
YQDTTGTTFGAVSGTITIGNAGGDVTIFNPSIDNVLKPGQKFTINWIAPPNFYPSSLLIALLFAINAHDPSTFIFLTPNPGNVSYPLYNQSFSAVIPANVGPNRGCNIYLHIHNETTGQIFAYVSNPFVVISD